MRVIDGDTLGINYRGSRVGIGLIGIEAPQGNTACGKEAADQLQGLVMGGVRLEEDKKIVFDDRGLRMSYAITPEGSSVGEELASAGVARATGQGKDAKHLKTLQAAARKDKKGCLWGGERSTGGMEALSQAPRDVDDLAAVGSGGELSAAAIESGFTKEVVARQLVVPTAFTFLPDGRILIAEKSGRIRVYKDGALLSQPLIDISGQVNDYWDRGLSGIAADPHFSDNGYVYLLFTYEDDPAQYDSTTKTARLIRVTATGDSAAPESEKVILGHVVGRPCKDLPADAGRLPSDYYSVRLSLVFSRSLAPGSHTLQIRVLGTKNASSSGRRVDVDTFIVMP